MSVSAERRRCPVCGRKSAVRREYDPIAEEHVRWCRWDDCSYVVVTPRHGTG